VRYTRNEGLYLGELNGDVSDRLTRIANAVQGAGILTITSQNIRSVEWSKLIGWLALTAPAVLTRVVTHRLVQDPDVARLQVLLAKEASQITDRLDIPLEDLFMASPSRTLVSSKSEEWMAQSRQYGLNMETQGLTSHKMSALQDLERGRRLEVEETFGYVVRKAAELGLAVPRLESCYRLLLALDRSVR
jgi:2-dehydropantoate 2-reductase